MNTTLPTPYPELNSVLQGLVARVQAVLADNFVGFYLQGSFAVGDFDLNSDCDFIVVIERELSMEEVAALQVVHEYIFSLDQHWAKHLEGSYFPKNILRDIAYSGGQLWYLDHGSRSLIRDKHCNTVLVRWVVREYAVTLAGPPPRALVDPIPVAKLRHQIRATMRDFGDEIKAHSEQYNNRFYQAFIVLNYCRMLHDWVRGYPGSKRAGAEWVKANLDPSWASLIDRTWAGRFDPAVAVRTPADPGDFQATLQFVQYILKVANDWNFMNEI
jgi:predicted nucleotidyltransferase